MSLQRPIWEHKAVSEISLKLIIDLPIGDFSKLGRGISINEGVHKQDSEDTRKRDITIAQR